MIKCLSLQVVFLIAIFYNFFDNSLSVLITSVSNYLKLVNLLNMLDLVIVIISIFTIIIVEISGYNPPPLFGIYSRKNGFYWLKYCLIKVVLLLRKVGNIVFKCVSIVIEICIFL